MYCSFITCVTVTSVGQHLATYFAEWQIMSCSAYATILFWVVTTQTHVALMKVQTVFPFSQTNFSNCLYCTFTECRSKSRKNCCWGCFLSDEIVNKPVDNEKDAFIV